MYNIEQKDYGIKVTFSGFIKMNELEKWEKEFKKAVDKITDNFGLIIDMRNVRSILKQVEEKIDTAQEQAKEEGLERSFIVFKDFYAVTQFRPEQNYAWERFTNASMEPNWEVIGINWIKEGIEPNA